MLSGGQLFVAHDAAGFSGAWLLEAAILQHLKSGDWWQFDNRGAWIKGTQQAKAVTAKHTAAVKDGSEQRHADGAGQAAPARQLHLSASGIAANCPLPAVPSSNTSGDGKVVPPDNNGTGSCSKQQHREAPYGAALPAAQHRAGADAAGAATLLVQPQAAAASPGGGGSLSECGSIACLGSGFVPLDDVELKLRGSPRGSPRRMGSAASRSCSPSPTHKAASQQRQGLLHDHASGSSSAAGVAASRPPAASLQGIAALVSRAAAAAPVAAWDALSSRRSSAGDLRHPTGRRVSGSIAPAKMVPLLVGSNRSSSSEDFSIAAESTGERQEGKGCPEQVAAGSGLECTASSALTHSSDGKPCRLVRCSSSYLGRSSSSSGAQLTTHEQRGVRFLEWAEQVEFDAAALQGRSTVAGHSSGTSSSSSIQSFTEEQLLEAQGGWEFVRPPEASSSYTTLIKADSCGGRAGSCPAIPADQGSLAAAAAASTARGGGAGSGELQEVSLVMSKPVSLVNKARGGGSEYQLHVYTADKIAAALPAGQQVCVQVLGSTGALLTTQLPR